MSCRHPLTATPVAVGISFPGWGSSPQWKILLPVLGSQHHPRAPAESKGITVCPYMWGGTVGHSIVCVSRMKITQTPSGNCCGWAQDYSNDSIPALLMTPSRHLLSQRGKSTISWLGTALGRYCFCAEALGLGCGPSLPCQL